MTPTERMSSLPRSLTASLILHVAPQREKVQPCVASTGRAGSDQQGGSGSSSQANLDDKSTFSEILQRQQGACCSLEGGVQRPESAAF